MSTHNISFRQVIRKILYGYPLLSVGTLYVVKWTCSKWRTSRTRSQDVPVFRINVVEQVLHWNTLSSNTAGLINPCPAET